MHVSDVSAEYALLEETPIQIITFGVRDNENVNVGSLTNQLD